LVDLSSGKKPLFIFRGIHEEGEALTALAVDAKDEKLVTADTKGRFKLWDISPAKFKSGLSHSEIRSQIRLCWYI
jgi:hypothetical protein